MKTLWSGVLTGLLVVALAGCNTSSTGGTGGTRGTGAAGGPGGAGGGGPPPGGGTFSLKAPATAPTVKQGSSETVKLTVDKDKDFKEDVELSATVSLEGKGVSVELDPKAWKPGGPSEVSAKVTATDKAPPAEYTITVTPKPAKGHSTPVTFKVTVAEKK
jgi:hypothetical protein